MKQRGDEVKVGVMVIATVALLLVTFFLMTNYNPFQTAQDEYTVRFKFAGGLEKDAVVRFGGIKRGKVTAVRLTPQSPTAAEVVLELQPGTGVKTDSIARVAALGALGENYIEISPGLMSSPVLKPGETIRSEETPEFSDLFAQMSALADNAQKVMADVNKDINQISGQANTLLTNLNDTTGPQNRHNISAALEGANKTIANANGMITNANSLIASTSPKIEAITSNLQASSEKIDKLTTEVGDATTKMSKLLENVDSTVTENRPQLKKDIAAMAATLTDLQKLLAETTAMLDANRSDFNVTMEELRRSSENLGQLTDGVKQRPFSLIRIQGQPDRKVPK
jgi:phospholipid/cholesterol/gamma-HCH transport system substrate-binding protein